MGGHIVNAYRITWYFGITMGADILVCIVRFSHPIQKISDTGDVSPYFIGGYLHFAALNFHRIAVLRLRHKMHLRRLGEEGALQVDFALPL